MIVAAAVCPHPPLLLRELSGAHDAVPELRRACLEAVAAATRHAPDVVVVVGGADEARSWDPSLPAPVRVFGTTGPADGPSLPLSLGVGRRLLAEAGWTGRVETVSVSWDASGQEVADLADRLAGRVERIALLVLGDGSARRGEKAPGYLDERAFAVDDGIAAALEKGDPPALAGLDAGLAQELMVLGRAAFAVLGEAVVRSGSTPRARLLLREDPFGVQYLVALWEM